MKSWSPSLRAALVAGIALILVVNAIVLGGASYNRAGNPDSVLELTERELELPYDWGIDRDNSGLALRLRWQIASPRVTRFSAENDLERSGLSLIVPDYLGRDPGWLDSTKLAELGIHPDPAALDPEAGRRHYRSLAKRVLLVFELDGPAYRMMRSRHAELIAQEEARIKETTDSVEIRRRRVAMASALRDVEQVSRLFVVDAGLDRAALRAQYPDRSRYAIVPGEITAGMAGPDSAAYFAGTVYGVSAESITVPFGFRDVFASMQRRTRESDPRSSARYSVTVAFGRRLEPWITEAKR